MPPSYGMTAFPASSAVTRRIAPLRRAVETIAPAIGFPVAESRAVTVIDWVGRVAGPSAPRADEINPIISTHAAILLVRIIPPALDRVFYRPCNTAVSAIR